MRWFLGILQALMVFLAIGALFDGNLAGMLLMMIVTLLIELKLIKRRIM
jgi:hypothetical protein